jgi:hypothetical protein
MTVYKPRPPVSFELALTKVAAVIGWDEAGRIVDNAPSTVRAWSDQDVAAGIRLDAALKLDTAYKAAGGEGPPPMLQCYLTRLEADVALATSCKIELALKAGKAAKEGGEAIAAVIAAAQPGACEKTIARAELETEEAIAAHTDTLATLRAGRRGNVESGGCVEGDAAARPGEGK